MVAADDDKEQERDAAILARIVARDPRGIELLYDRFAGVAFAVAYRLIGERGRAEDVVQEAFLNVWRHGATYDTRRGTVRAWLLTVVHHRAVDVRRSMRAKAGADTALDDAPHLTARDDTLGAVVRGMEHERVRRALDALPPEQRQIVDLAYFGGLSQTEISARTGIPLGTVKGRTRLALGKLRDLLAVPDAMDQGMERTR